MTTTKQTTKEVSPAKAALIAISDKLKGAKLINALPSEYDFCVTTNDLLRVYYNVGNQEMKTFNQWKAEGKFVKKGEKGYAFWTKPMTAGKKEDGANGEQKESSYNFFGICYLFTESQVQ
jgi:hypothetical protein